MYKNSLPFNNMRTENYKKTTNRSQIAARKNLALKNRTFAFRPFCHFIFEKEGEKIPALWSINFHTSYYSRATKITHQIWLLIDNKKLSENKA